MSHVRRYLDALTGGYGVVTWQTFDDRGRDGALASIRHGTVEQHGRDLFALNSRGAGVFVSVNETDLRGRSASNVVALRALFCDDDGTRNREWIRSPSFVVHSAAGDHAYWLLRPGEPLDAFRAAQRALARYHHTDESVVDLPRVLRCPGFFHRKSDPVAVTFEPGTMRRYSVSEVTHCLPDWCWREPVRYVSPAPMLDHGNTDRWWHDLRRPIAEGGRNNELYRLAYRVAESGCSDLLGEVHALNASLCSPPLPDYEVEAIVRQATRRQT